MGGGRGGEGAGDGRERKRKMNGKLWLIILLNAREQCLDSGYQPAGFRV